MKRSCMLLTALAVMMYLGGVSAFAQHGGGHGGGPSGGHGGPGTHGASASHGSTKGSKEGAGGGSAKGGKTVGNLLTQNTKLSSKLQSLLPAGTDLKSASSGFKNLGQFVAAVHVYNNLGLQNATPPVSFSDFAKAVNAKGGSLGKAIQQFNPKADSKAEAKKGSQQSKDDLKETG